MSTYSYQRRHAPAAKRSPAKRKSRFGCAITLFIVALFTITLIIGAFRVNRFLAETAFFNNGKISDAVRLYEPDIAEAAAVNGIPEYVLVLEAMMMQESKGRGGDPMQASESHYNTQYPQTIGGITDPRYSIQVGVTFFADLLVKAECTSPADTGNLLLALQGYNFGDNYIVWARENYGGYSVENARVYSQMMQQELGWKNYGDPEYAASVMKYITSNQP